MEPRVAIRKLSDFRPLEANPNRHTQRGLRALEDSVQEDGWVAPVTVAADGESLDGAARLEVAADKFNDEALVVEHDGRRPVIMVRTDVADAKTTMARRIVYRANRVASLDLDWSAEQVLADLDAGVDLAGLWDESELDELLKEIVQEEPPADAEPQFDKAEALLEKWGVKLGDLWHLGEHYLLCGDSTVKTNVERLMQGEKADLVVTSPPYAVGKEYEKEISFDKHLIMLRAFADRLLEFVEPGGFAFINFDEIAPQSHTKPLTGSERQCLYPISKDYWQIFHVEYGMDLYAQRIWHKPFNRLQQPFWTYHTSIPHHQEWEHIWTWRLPGGDSDECYDWNVSVRAVWDTRDEATNDRPLTRHVAAFPVGIPERAIRAHSKKDAIVWEPFCGSGTTIVACQNLGRKCRAIEIHPPYVAICLERMATAFPDLEIERIE